MAQITISDGVVNVDITSQSLTIGHPKVAALVAAVETLHVIVPLARVRLRPDSQGQPGEYEYLIQTADGRSWRQTFLFDPPNETQMKFTVNQWWTLSEFAPHRAIRDHLVEAVQLNGLTFFDYRW